MLNSSEKIENLLGQLPHLDSRPFTSALSREYSRRDAGLSVTPANVLFALQRARQAREFAISYRDFNVGASLLAFQFAPARMQLVTGVNIKPEQDSSINIHAEQSALRKVAQAGFNAVGIIAVVGETQNDQQSGHEMCTLHPCGLCRAVLKASPLIDADQTLIVTALPDLHTIELSTIARLEKYHDKKQFDQVTTLDVPNLSLLKPVETDGPIVIEDTEELWHEEKTWHELLDPHLMPFRIAAMQRDDIPA